MDRKLLLKKVFSKLEDQDYEMVSDFVRNNLNNPDKVMRYFQNYKIRNKLTTQEKQKILQRLDLDGIDLKKEPWNKVIETLETRFN